MNRTLKTALFSGALSIVFAGGLSLAADAPNDGRINWDRARELFEKKQKGEKLSDEEQAYLDKAKSQQDGAGRRGDGAAPGAGRAFRGEAPNVDPEKLQELMKKARSGQELTDDEKALLQRVKAARGEGDRGNGDRGNGARGDGAGRRGEMGAFGMLPPPDMIVRHSADLGLDEKQVEAIRGEMQKAQDKFPELQKALVSEMSGLAQDLQGDKIDSDKAAAKLDKVLDAERQIKRAQLMLSISIRNHLTSEQIHKFQENRHQWMSDAGRGEAVVRGRRGDGEANANPNPAPGRRGGELGAAGTPAIREKLEQLSILARNARENGGDPSPAARAMDEVRGLLRDGKTTEAEAALDKAIKSMEQNKEKK